MTRARLTLYGRGYCHLCDDMRAALAPFETQYDIALALVDIDLAGDPDLLARYDELVPVLVAALPDGGQRQLCHYFLDPSALQAYLQEAGASSAP